LRCPERKFIAPILGNVRRTEWQTDPWPWSIRPLAANAGRQGKAA
jgi:hypothetical protein